MGRAILKQHGDSLYSGDCVSMSSKFSYQNEPNQFVDFRRSSPHKKGSSLRQVCPHSMLRCASSDIVLRIIKDSYLKEQPENRPRIFGMTASPIDTKGDIAKAAA